MPVIASASDLPPDFAKAKVLFEATKRLKFAEIPAVDLKDRISVLTIASGLRRAGVLETWGQRLPRTRDLMISQGLFTSVATCVWSRIERPSQMPYAAVLQALDEKRVAGKPKHVLWLYDSAESREMHRMPSFTQQQAGTLLQYPSCCVEFESGFMSKWSQANLEHLITTIGEDEEKLLAAVGRMRKFPDLKIPLPDNGLRTERQFPFALHVACDSCLSTPGSPSHLVNTRYSDLVREVSPDLHAVIEKIQGIYGSIERGQDNNRDLLIQIRMLHNAFFEQAH